MILYAHLVSFFFGFVIFLIGLLIGSFLNVLIDRLPNGKSILGRSHCEKCKRTLVWKDLIPLLSFAYLKRKCRYCHVTLSYQYPFIEVLTGVLFVFSYIFVTGAGGIFNEFLNLKSLIINLFYYFFIVSSFIVIFFTDLKHGIIPDKIVFPAIIVFLVYIFIYNFYPLSSGVPPSIFNHLLSAFGAFLFFLFIFLITKAKGMGFGDVKLAFLLGLILGFPGVVLALYIAFLTGGTLGLILILWKKKSMKFAVPFGPFLVLGALISFFFGSQIIPKIWDLLL